MRAGAEFDAALYELMSDGWTAFHGALAEPWLVRPAIPVLYFGDLKQYLASEVRVITVGLNPSVHEFPAASPFQRFPAAATLNPLQPGWEQVHQQALDGYFQADPLLWFGSWEPVLTGLDASYWSGAKNVALHTDLCSPLATNPTWSDLDVMAKTVLEPTGHRLWRRLAALLAPHVLLVSIAASYLRQIHPLPLAEWSICHPSPGRPGAH